jgi:hypothetical protein
MTASAVNTVLHERHAPSREADASSVVRAGHWVDRANGGGRSRHAGELGDLSVGHPEDDLRKLGRESRFSIAGTARRSRFVPVSAVARLPLRRLRSDACRRRLAFASAAE